MSGDLNQTVAQLQATLGNMEVALNAIEDAIVCIGRNNCVQWCNTAFKRLVNCDDVLERSLPELLPLVDRHQSMPIDPYSAFRRLQNTDNDREYYLWQDGICRTLELSGHPVELANQPPGLILVIRDVTEAKQSAQQREETLSLLQATLESTADGILVVAPGGQILSYNQKFVHMWGIPESLLAPDSDPVERYHFLAHQTQDPEGFITRATAQIEQRSDVEGYNLLQMKDGRVFERYSQPQRLNGQIIARVLSYRDVTDRQHQEDALRLIVEGTASKTGEQFFQSCVSYLAQAIQVPYALLLEFCDETKTTVRVLGDYGDIPINRDTIYSLIGTPCENAPSGQACYYPAQVRSLFPNSRGLLKRNAESYLGIPLSDSAGEIVGHLVVMDTKPMPNDPGREMILQIFAARAGAELERRLAEQALRESEQKFRSIFENSQVGIGRTRIQDGLILEANHRFATMMGYASAEEMVGKIYSSSLYPRSVDRQRIITELYSSSGVHQNFELQLQRCDGTLIWGLLSLQLNRKENCIDFVIADISDRKQAEEALRLSEAKFRALYESAGVAVVIGDEQGMLDCNSAMEQLFGYSRQELVGRHPSDFSPPFQPNGEDSRSLSSRLIQIAAEQGSHRFEWVHRRADGTLFPAEVWLTVVEVGNRRIIQAVTQDLTERKQAEAALAERAALAAFRADVDSALAQSHGLATMLQRCADAAVRHLDAAFVRIWVLNPESGLLELRASAGLHTRLDGQYSRISVGRLKIGSIADLGQPYITNDLLQNDWVENKAWAEQAGLTAFAGYPLMLEGELVGVIAMFARQPITESVVQALGFAAGEMALGVKRKQAEAALQESETRFRQLAETIESVFWMTNADTNELLYISPAYERIWGRSCESLYDAALNWLDAIYPEDRDRVLSVLPEQAQGSYDEEYRIMRPNGEIRWIRDRAFPIHNQTGQVYRIVGIQEDISDRKWAEEALKQQQEVLRMVINTVPNMIFVKDWEGRYLLANQATADFYSTTVETLIGKRDLDLHPLQAIAEQFLQENQQVIETGEDLFIPEEKTATGSEQEEWLQWQKRRIKLPGDDVYSVLGVGVRITERKRTEAALRESQERLRLITDSLPACISYIDRHQRYQFVNRTYETWFGLSRDQINGMQVRELVGEQAYATVQPYLQQVLLAGETVSYEAELPYQHGGSRYTTSTFVPDVDEQGCVKGCYALITDISDRNRLEKELRHSQQLLDSIVENLPIALFTKDVTNDFRYVQINKNAERVLGINREQAIGHTDYDFLPHDLADHYRVQDQNALTQGQIIQTDDQIVLPDTQETIYVRGFKLPLFDNYEQPTYLVCFSEDITERKRQEDALRLIVEGTASKIGDEFFRTCARYLAEVLRVRYAIITEFADAAKTRLHTVAVWTGEAIGENFECEVAGTPCENAAFGSICFYPNGIQSRFPGCTFFAEVRAESYLGVPLVDSSGSLLGHLAVLDVKPLEPEPGREMILKIFAARVGAELERKQFETVLKRAKEQAEAANRAKSAFLANMSHELRTPLNAILGFAQLMERDPSLSPQQRESLSTINRSGAHLLNLINDVLEMSKIEAGRTLLRLKPFDLHRLLHTLQEMFQIRAETKWLSLQFEIGEDVPQYVLSDEGKLRQILINLLSNAIKFTESGHVILRVALGGAIESKVDSQRGGVANPMYRLIFAVEDTGPGIALEEQPHLFQPFVQTGSAAQIGNGTGLGLAISRQFVQLMGGDIHLTSAPGQGATFQFDIKVGRAKAADVASTGVDGRVIRLAPNQPTYRILIVDDQPENRDLLMQLLQGVGFQTQAVADGEEAIQQWRNWHPHLIWMDMRMPVMDGYTATRQIRSQLGGQATVIIALTASAFEEECSAVLAAGCDDFVRKPFQTEVIFEKLAEHLGVRYLYETLTFATPLSSGILYAPLSAQDLRVLPPEWVECLYQAAVRVDADQIFQLLEQIPPDQSILAERLADLTRRFCFDELVELTQQT